MGGVGDGIVRKGAEESRAIPVVGQMVTGCADNGYKMKPKSDGQTSVGSHGEFFWSLAKTLDVNREVL